jgi:chitodextrinase
MSNVFEVDTGLPTDFARPSQPARLRLISQSDSSIAMEWDPSWDNVGVSKYCVWRNGARIALVRSTWFVDKGLAKQTQYEYAVSAFDAAGNESLLQQSRSIRTTP